LADKYAITRSGTVGAGRERKGTTGWRRDSKKSEISLIHGTTWGRLAANPGMLERVRGEQEKYRLKNKSRRGLTLIGL